jgi:hypothetical protein
MKDMLYINFYLVNTMAEKMSLAIGASSFKQIFKFFKGYFDKAYQRLSNFVKFQETIAFRADNQVTEVKRCWCQAFEVNFVHHSSSYPYNF